MRRADDQTRVLAALRELGGAATLAQIARRANITRERADRALYRLHKRRDQVAPEPQQTRALRGADDTADRVWRLL
jgi:hypothetical protein